jgi:hypothetical protein
MTAEMADQQPVRIISMERRSTKVYYLWLMLLAGVAACVATGMEQERQELTEGANRAEIVSRWDGQEDMGAWVARELFVENEAVNAPVILATLRSGRQ